MSKAPISDRTARMILAIDSAVLGLARHWLLYASIILGILVLAPFAAPALMATGATGPARVIYLVYSLICHQLPERSYFLFGPKISYTFAEIGRVWKYQDVLSLREFVGNGAMGWKVAWSDRMVSLYGSVWAAGLLFSLMRRRRLPALSPLVWVIVGVLPIFIDGFSHTVNDALAGVSGTGFRDTNAWLAFLTANTLPASFYRGDALGSFNSLMRSITGALFGITSVWLIYPMVDRTMHELGVVTRSRLSSPRALQLRGGYGNKLFVQEGRQ